MSRRKLNKRFIFRSYGYALILLLLLVGCGDKDPYTAMSDKDYRVGTDGLVYTFAPSGPPPKVFEGGVFDIASEIWNKGATNVDEGYVTANLENSYMCLVAEPDENAQCIEKTTGFNSAVTKDIVSANGESLKGKSVFYPKGTSVYMNFYAKALPLDLLSVQHTSPVILTSCYKYRTEWAEEVCIDPDITGTREVDKPCNVEDIILSDQGGPIAVTKIETKILPDNQNIKVQFIVYVENKGPGETVNDEKVKDACSSTKLSHEDWNRVKLANFKLTNENYYYSEDDSSSTIDCKPNPIKLIDKKGYIRCTIDNTKLSDDMKITKTSPAIKSQTYMNFLYGYTHSESQSVVIEKIR